MSIMPEHHRRYAVAWSLYKDDSLSEQSKLLLEREMDDAQNYFNWDEFQEFKLTLPGFMEHWDGMKEEVLSELEKRFGDLAV